MCPIFYFGLSIVKAVTIPSTKIHNLPINQWDGPIVESALLFCKSCPKWIYSNVEQFKMRNLHSLPCPIKYFNRFHTFHHTATSNARFWVWVHILVNLVAMAFLFTMNLCLLWVLNFNLSQARLLKETACNYVFSVLVHGIPSISAWISIHQNSQKLFCAKTSIGH